MICRTENMMINALIIIQKEFLRPNIMIMIRIIVQTIEMI